MLPRRIHEISRLEAFSDAVFAFALTLLVVSLQVPKSYDELINLMSGFPAFACCFGVLLWIWYEHNIFFRRYGLQDPYTVLLNGILLFVVMFYVYPLKFMFDAGFGQFLPKASQGIAPLTMGQLAHASAIYGLGFLVLFIMFALLYRHAYTKRQELELTPRDIQRQGVWRPATGQRGGGRNRRLDCGGSPAPLRLHFADGLHSHVAGARTLRGPDKKEATSPRGSAASCHRAKSALKRIISGPFSSWLGRTSSMRLRWSDSA